MADSEFSVQHYLAQLTTQPGVYRMLGTDGDVLYIGKARNLKKRVSTYFLRASGNPRIEAMVDQITGIEVTVTNSEDEALLLECSLIKSLKPRYNVLLKDDKSYPYLRLTGHAYPRIVFHRGKRLPGDQYFGPFPSAATVRDTIGTLQKIFLLRGCSDSYFANRSRPCLQHQIKRCSAPCVSLISPEDYASSVTQLSEVMQGDASAVVARLQTTMDTAAAALQFETAAQLRDKIAAIRRLQEQRIVTGVNADLDVIAMQFAAGLCGISVLSVRAGQLRGQRTHFPKVPADVDPEELMEAFLEQFYTAHEPPGELVLSQGPREIRWLERALQHRWDHRVIIKLRVRAVRRRLLDMAQASVAEAVKQRLLSRKGLGGRLAALQGRFGLVRLPERLECFDISHSAGEATVASCVVFSQEGPAKSLYRRFNIEGVTAGDDYAAMAQAVHRRFRDAANAVADELPDVLLIDGGAGQLKAATDALHGLKCELPLIIGVAKGVTRKPGMEQLFLPGLAAPVRLEADDPALHLIQQIRDEAHRFAITGHRGRRGKARIRSELDEIAGLGPKRRHALLRAFGGLKQLRRASADDLEKVPGINRSLATRVYYHLHENDN